MSVSAKPDQRPSSRQVQHDNGSGSEDSVQRQRLISKQRDASTDSNYGTIANTAAASSSSSSLPPNAIQHISSSGNTPAVSRTSYTPYRTDSAAGSIYAADYGPINVKSGRNTPTPKDAGPQRILGKVKQRKYWSYYVPIVSWAPVYKPKALIGDILAGLTASAGSCC